jgi:hypothetical protein
MLCAIVKAVTVFTKEPRAARNNQQCQDKQQMVDAEQNVLYPELEIDARDGSSRSAVAECWRPAPAV